MPGTATFTYGKFVWFEHMSPDVKKAQAFYQALLGWSTHSVPMGETPYPMIQSGGKDIAGYRQAAATAPTHWICFVSVPDVDASFNAIKAMGCRTMQSPTDYGPGRIAAAADPTGASFALWTGRDGDRADAPVEVGDWHWTELWTSDENKAMAFYQSVFGYGVDSMSLGGADYHVLTMDGQPRAGLRKGSGPNGKSMWLPYVSVADCDATLAKAAALGATVMMPAVDAQGVGRYGVLVDPQGAPLGVITPTAGAA